MFAGDWCFWPAGSGEIRSVDLMKINNVDLMKINNVDRMKINNVEFMKINNVNLMKINNVEFMKINNVDLMKISNMDLMKISNVDLIKINNVDLMKIYNAAMTLAPTCLVTLDWSSWPRSYSRVYIMCHQSNVSSIRIADLPLTVNCALYYCTVQCYVCFLLHSTAKFYYLGF